MAKSLFSVRSESIYQRSRTELSLSESYLSKCAGVLEESSSVNRSDSGKNKTKTRKNRLSRNRKREKWTQDCELNRRLKCSDHVAKKEPLETNLSITGAEIIFFQTPDEPGSDFLS
jgi:hypothetical protein